MSAYMTYRERRERRIARLREWATKREQKAEAAYERADEIAAPIPSGQPVLRGHHSERRHRRDLERINAAMRRGFEHADKARDFERRADTIEAQLERSIYDDDPDAIERLEARIAALEARRARVKRYNASCRKGQRDLSILSDDERAELRRLAEIAPFQVRANGAAPSYWTANISAEIRRNRERLERLQREREHLPA